MSESSKPLPIPTAESIPFWEACRNGELRLQRCDRCGEFAFPPTSRCPNCLEASLTWTKTSGRGKVHSFVVYHRAYHPGFEKELPYAVALIELNEGPRLISTIVGCDVKAIHCDMPVEVTFQDSLYKFRPLTSDRGNAP